jgi:hypothetical protein
MSDDVNVMTDRDRLNNFTKNLNREPKPSDIQINKQAGGAKYLPISFVENQLDELYFGLWSTENFRHSVIANEVVGSIDLKVFHPVSMSWLTRVGVASVPIQQEAGADSRDADKKIKNALVKNFPSLKAECLKNACKSLGKFFGRDLSRKDKVDVFEPIQSKSPLLRAVNNENLEV